MLPWVGVKYSNLTTEVTDCQRFASVLAYTKFSDANVNNCGNH